METPSPAQLERRQKEIAAANVRAIRDLSEIENTTVEQLDAFLIAEQLKYQLRCTRCFNLGITSGEIRYFHKDGSAFLCYKCLIGHSY